MTKIISIYIVLLFCFLNYNVFCANLPEFTVCNHNFEDASEIIVLDGDEYYIEHSGTKMRLFTKTPINKYVFREEYIQYSPIRIGEIEEFDNYTTFHDKFNFTDSLCRSYISNHNVVSEENKPILIKQIVTEFKIENGCELTILVQQFNDSGTVLLANNDILVQVGKGSIKISMILKGWPFDDYNNYISIRSKYSIHTQKLVSPLFYDVGPADPNYPDTMTKFANVTANNASFTIGLQKWSVVDDVIQRIKITHPADNIVRDSEVSDEEYGVFFDNYWIAFHNNMTHDPSLAILFFGDENAVQPPLTNPPTNVPTPTSPTSSIVPDYRSSSLAIGVSITVIAVIIAAVASGYLIYRNKKLRSKIFPFIRRTRGNV